MLDYSLNDLLVKAVEEELDGRELTEEELEREQKTNPLLNSGLVDLTDVDYDDERYWDIIGVLGAVPYFKKEDDVLKFKFTLFQTQNHSIEISFNVENQKDEPMFQRLNNDLGAIIFVKYIQLVRKGEAGLCAPIDKYDMFGRKHHNHRTFFAIDATTDDLIQVQKGKRKYFDIHKRASIIPPPALGKNGNGKRGKFFPMHKDERIAVKALIPVALRFRYHLSKLDNIEPDEIYESKMATYVHTTHSKNKNVLPSKPETKSVDDLGDLVSNLKLDDAELEQANNLKVIKEMILNSDFTNADKKLSFEFTERGDFVQKLNIDERETK